MKNKSKRELVFAFVSRIPRGRVLTYAAVARACGTSPRAVDAILKSNPEPVIVPCHRVIASDGTLGGYFGKMRSRWKRALLESEGIIIKGNNKGYSIDLARFGYNG